MVGNIRARDVSYGDVRFGRVRARVGNWLHFTPFSLLLLTLTLTPYPHPLRRMLQGSRLRLRVYLRHRAAEVSDGPHFDLRAVGKDRAGLGEPHRLVHARNPQPKITGNGFLGFGKHPVSDSRAVRAADNFAFLHEGLGAEMDAALFKLADPGVKVRHHALQVGR